MMKQKPRRFFLLLFALESLAGTAALVWLLDWHPLGAWLLSANVTALLFWIFDKISARRGGWRVPEFALHVMSFLGATPAAFVGMKFLRHKTLKLHFVILYSVLFLLQLALLMTWSQR